mgnify:FL=1
MHTTVNDYRVRIVDEKNRINDLIEECRYDILNIPHIDMNEFVEQLVLETIRKMEEAQDSGFDIEPYVFKHFGIE